MRVALQSLNLRFYITLIVLVAGLFFNPILFAENNDDRIYPDGDPSIGVPVKLKSFHHNLAGGHELNEFDKTTGNRTNTFSTPTRQALSPEQYDRLMAQKEQKQSEIDPTELRFRSGYRMYPVRGIAPELSLPAESDGAFTYLVVQFGDEVKREILDDLEGSGITFYDYVHFNAYYARVPSGSQGLLDELLAADEIRYVGPIPSQAKIDAALLQQITSNPIDEVEVVVQFFDVDPVRMQNVSDRFVKIFAQSPQKIIGKASGEFILEIYQMEYTRWIEAWMTPELHNLEGRMIHGADIIANLGTYTGSGVNVATMDTGIAQQGSTYHPDLPGTRIIDEWDYQNNDAIANDDYGNSHGTHVAGSLGGEGNNQVPWSGMAPEANLHIYKLCCGTGQFSWFEDALQRAADQTVRVINNSWGGGTAGAYNSNSELADRAVRGEFGRYMSLVVSSGNDNNIVKSPGTAKNVITVGAVHDGNWPNVQEYMAGCWDYVWPPGDRACFSNYGPIDADGNGWDRIKPDVVSTGPRTYSTAAWYTEGAYYRILDGTSMSAPKVTGLIALFLDAYPGYVTWPEMVKARMIASAINIGNSDYYGHGLVDAYHFVYNEPGVMENVLNITSSVANNDDSKTYTFTVPSGFHEVRVVLTWADPAGSEEAINDLDLRVYDDAGSLRGSSASYDHVVEKVIATSGTPGTWQVTVDPYNLGLPPQAFALTAYVIMDPPSLALNAWSSQRWLRPGETFYFYTELDNSGGPAAGSYVWLNAPNGTLFQVLGGRLYPDEGYGRSEYYYEDEIHAHTTVDYNEYSMGTGLVTGVNTPLVRWFVQVDPDTTFNGDTYFYSRGYARNGLSTIQQTVSVGVDDTPPSNPSSLYSTSHAVGVWNSDRTVNLVWSGAMDNVSGVYGYSWTNSTSSTTVPDAAIDTTGTGVTTGALGDSANWYFHVRTLDNAENWNSGAKHAGPYRIDGTVPNNPTVFYSTSHVAGVWSNDRTVNLVWSGATDNLSGVYGYSWANSTSPTTLPNTTVDTTGTAITTGALGDSANWYFHVRAQDNATNWNGSAVHIGPYKIDATAPYSTASSPVFDTGGTIPVSFSAGDATSGFLGAYLYYKKGSGGTWTNSLIWLTSTSEIFYFSPPAGNGTYYFATRAQDNAFNWEAQPTGSGDDSTIYDTVGPTGNISINGGAADTTTILVTLTLAADDLISGVDQMRFSNNAASWSSWEPYSTTKSNWNLSGYGGNTSPGTKTVYVQFMDTAGNASNLYSDEIQYTPESLCTGDLNNDYVVDSADLLILAEDYGRNDCLNAIDCPGDTNGDGDVDGGDLAEVVGDFGETNCW